MSRENIARVGVVRPGHRRKLGVRLATRLWLWSPAFLRSLVWRRIPRSRFQRAALVDLIRWGYERQHETGFFPTAFVSQRIEIHQAAELVGTTGTFHGHEGMEEAMHELREAWGVLRFEPEEVFEVGDRLGLVILVRARTEGLGSGVPVDRVVAHVLRVQEGTVTRFDVYWEPSDAFTPEALEAVGLRE